MMILQRELFSIAADNDNIIGCESHGDLLTGLEEHLAFGTDRECFEGSAGQLNFVFYKRSLVR
jgi:hypothetical protein